MNGYEMISLLQQKMQNPNFARRFNQLSNELSKIPGLQNELMRIAQIDNEKKRQDALNRLPDQVKKAAKELMSMLGI